MASADKLRAALEAYTDFAKRLAAGEDSDFEEFCREKSHMQAELRELHARNSKPLPPPLKQLRRPRGRRQPGRPRRRARPWALRSGAIASRESSRGAAWESSFESTIATSAALSR